MNEYEKLVADALTRKGWTVLHRGWPDLLCVNLSSDELQRKFPVDYKKYDRMRAFAVELKRGKDRPTPEQLAVHHILNRVGLPTRVAREKDIAEITRSRGTVFTAPESRRELLLRVEELTLEVQRKLRELETLKQNVQASTVLFDGDEPEFRFEYPADEVLLSSGGPQASSETVVPSAEIE